MSLERVRELGTVEEIRGKMVILSVQMEEILEKNLTEIDLERFIALRMRWFQLDNYSREMYRKELADE